LFGSELEAALLDTTGSKVVSALHASKVGRNDLIFVPSENEPFWDMTPGQCSAASFFIPAMVGVPMLMGLPPAGACVLEWYGFENYRSSARSRPATENELCDRALHMGFQRVIVLHSIGSSQQGSALNCKRPATEPQRGT
jgi:hypothetical protein